MYTIPFSTYADKVRGCWFGKCLGGSAGAPVEGFKKVEGVSSFREIIDVTLPNDDLDIQLLWVELLQKKGPYFGREELAKMWEEKCTYFFSEYGYFMKNYKRGILPPLSGEFNNPFFKEGEGCPIRSEIWGVVFPGNPDRAAEYAQMDAQLDHAANSEWAEMFLAAAESMAFFENDVAKLIEDAMVYVPADSKLARCVRLVQACHAKGMPWKMTAQQVRNQFGHPDFTNSIQNMGFVVLSLLYGEGDMEKTVDICLLCGADTDCTAATAGSIIGIIHGYAAMPEDLKEMVADSFVMGVPVEREDNSLTSLTADTVRVGLSIATKTAYNPAVSFADVPADQPVYDWTAPIPAVSIAVEYADKPAIGREDATTVTLTVSNPLDQAVSGVLTLSSDNADIVWDVPSEAVSLAAGESVTLTRTATTGAITYIPQTNITTATLADAAGNTLATRGFGLAGAWLFRVYGPFCEQMESIDDPALPLCHGEGCDLPTLEAMVNNEVFLKKAYLNERALLRGEGVSGEDAVYDAGYLNAYEDFIPLDDLIGMEGQHCCYLETSVYFPEETEAWFVIGHNDGYRLYVNGQKIIEKDEIRYWTPYNSAARLTFKKGENRILIKALKRTEHYRFSIGIRTSRPGRYYHSCPWHTDLAYGIRE